MHSFKKIFTVSISFILFVILISAFLISGFVNSEAKFYLDRHYRDELQGELNCLIIGSSGGASGFCCPLYNEITGLKSYNLCGGCISGIGKIRLLEEEMFRNPIKKVILVIEDDDLTYDANKNVGEGEINYLPRIKSNIKRLSVLFNDVKPKDYTNIYATYLKEGMIYYRDIITGNYTSCINRENYGWGNREGKNIIFSEQELKSVVDSQTKIEEVKGNRQQFCNLIQMCKEANIEVVLLTLPVSENRILKYSNYNEWYNIYKLISEEYDCTFLDMNLLKDRQKILSEKNSYANENHLANIGAKKITAEFCNIMQMIENGEDVSDMFYDSYDEAIKHFEYYEIYQKLMQEQK